VKLYRSISVAMAVLFLTATFAYSEPSKIGGYEEDIHKFISTDDVILGDDEQNDTIDFGFMAKKGLIGDFVWNDSNENGIQDDGEEGLPGVNVSLYMLPDGEKEVFYNSTFSDLNGSYSFIVPFGRYVVKTGEGQKYGNGYIRIFDPTLPEDVRIFPWGEIDKIYAGGEENDSNDHKGSIVVMDHHDPVNTTIDFGYVKYY